MNVQTLTRLAFAVFLLACLALLAGCSLSGRMTEEYSALLPAEPGPRPEANGSIYQAGYDVQLFENAAATAGALIGLILMFGAVSGAHFNPVVTLTDRWFGTIRTRDAALYIGAQVVGGCIGAMLANLMFDLPAIDVSTKTRSSGALWLSEAIATVGLLLVIHGCVRTGRARVVPFAVAAWIGGAYWFTSSTSFANPAVTVARTLSDTFAGIAPASAPMFVAAQLVGAAIAFGLVRLFYPHDHSETPR